MFQEAGLYNILINYTRTNRSPRVDITAFIDTLEKHAKRRAENQPEWAVWTSNTSAKVWAELSRLAEENKCELRTDDSGTHIFMYRFYIDLIEEAYRSIDESTDRPFPDEASLQITIPQDQMRLLYLESDFSAYLEETRPREEPEPPIIKIILPGDAGEILALENMIPRTLADAAMLKLRNYLRSHSNKEYLQHKLGIQFPGKENQLKDMFNQILVRPLDCTAALMASGDFIYYFLAFLCSSIKTGIKEKKELLSEESAALQAVYIIESLNNFFKTLTVRQREKELAFKELELKLDKPPYLFTLEAIAGFSDSKGVPLLGRFSREELEQYIQTRITEHEENALPALLVIREGEGRQNFVKKGKLLPLCARLLVDARPKIKKAVLKRWVKLLTSYRREDAMDSDKEFEELLSQYIAETAPVLAAVLQDQKLYMVCEELERNQAFNESFRLFNKGVLIPLSALLLVKRKELLADARIMLPFWYHFPLIAAILAFFKSLKQRRLQKKDGGGEDKAGEESRDGDEAAREAAQKIVETYVPRGKTLDSCLAETASRWSKLLDKRARQNLIEDVNLLIRDRLRHTLRLQHGGRVTVNFIDTLAAKIQETPSLMRISDKNALGIYIQLYIVKLMMNGKI
ncbi:MAG: hypothetical protein LBQ14_00390 [Treponema sp.]|jgi:hypothetical protein|nr:hypothetical protein [Treponema sp.]